MGTVVMSGASITCPFALGPSTIVSGSKTNVTTGGGIVLTMMDCQPGTNIAPFPACTSMSNPAVAAATSAALGVLTPSTCTPVSPGPWTSEKSNVIIGGSPVLTQSCQLTCGYGGTITIAAPGQTKLNS